MGWRSAAVAAAVGLAGLPAFAADRTDVRVVEVAGARFRVDAPAGMDRFAAAAADVVRAHWPSIHNTVGSAGAPDVEVAIEREIEDWFARRGVPPRNPEWAAGLALYEEMAVIVRSSTPDWEATLRHELAHIAIDSAAGGHRVPRWFNEGLAIATAEQWSIERASTMIRAGLTGSFYAFDELTAGFPPAASSADLAYAQSFHLVQYVMRSYGDGVWVRVLDEVAAGRTWDDAFTAVLGATPDAVEQRWADHVRGRYRWAPAATGGGGAWGLVTVIGVWAVRRRRRDVAARLALMAEQERAAYAPDPDDATFG